MAALGAWRGFLREIFPALSLIGGGLSAAALQQKVSTLLDGFVKEGLGRDITAYAIVFMLVWAVVALAGYGLRRLTGRLEVVTAINRVAGFGVGVAKGCLALAIFVVILGLAPSMRKDVAKKSVSGPAFIALGNFTLETMSPGLAGKLEGSGSSGVMEKAKLLQEVADSLEKKKTSESKDQDKGKTQAK